MMHCQQHKDPQLSFVIELGRAVGYSCASFAEAWCRVQSSHTYTLLCQSVWLKQRRERMGEHRQFSTAMHI